MYSQKTLPSRALRDVVLRDAFARRGLPSTLMPQEMFPMSQHNLKRDFRRWSRVLSNTYAEVKVLRAEVQALDAVQIEAEQGQDVRTAFDVVRTSLDEALSTLAWMTDDFEELPRHRCVKAHLSQLEALLTDVHVEVSEAVSEEIDDAPDAAPSEAPDKTSEE